MAITNEVREVVKTIKHPVTGNEIERRAKVSRPVLKDATIEEILNFAGSEANLSELLQRAIDTKVTYLANLELGKAETNQKQLNAAIRNLKVVFSHLNDSDLRAMLMAMPGAKEKFENQEVASEVEMTIGAAEIFGQQKEEAAA